MAERIIDLMPLLDSDCDLFVLDRLFRAQVQAPTRQAEGTRDLAFGIGAVGYAKVMGQLHQLRGSYFPANSREAFFRISFCTVSSPMIFLRSSGEVPGS